MSFLFHEYSKYATPERSAVWKCPCTVLANRELPNSSSLGDQSGIFGILIKNMKFELLPIISFPLLERDSKDKVVGNQTRSNKTRSHWVCLGSFRGWRRDVLCAKKGLCWQGVAKGSGRERDKTNTKCDDKMFSVSINVPPSHLKRALFWRGTAKSD